MKFKKKKHTDSILYNPTEVQVASFQAHWKLKICFTTLNQEQSKNTYRHVLDASLL